MQKKKQPTSQHIFFLHSYLYFFFLHSYLYWTDWSSSVPRIGKATMDCRNITYIVKGKENLVWPNGITIDHQMGRLYWTDAYLDQIVSSDLNGGERKVVVSGSEIPHPYAIVVYKVNFYFFVY